MSTLIQFRRGSSTEWSSNSYIILASGEPAYETDTGRLKIGNGLTAWSGLDYIGIIPNESTFVRTTGNQIIGGNKSFSNQSIFSSGIISSGNIDVRSSDNNPAIRFSGITSTIFFDNGANHVIQYDGSGLLIESPSILFDGPISHSGSLSSLSGNFRDSLKLDNVLVSVSGHQHTTNDITNLTSYLSGLLPTISNSGNNRILTSTGESGIAINAENNLIFDGSTLEVSGNVNVSVTGDISTLKINKFYHNNLAVSSGISDTDLFITIINPTGSATTEVIQAGTLRSNFLNQPAVLRFRQGTEVERLLITPASGEPIWTTDAQKFYIGDGNTVGGDFMGPSPYGRGSGTQSILALNTGCVASGNYSTVGGGRDNISSGDDSTVGGGRGNISSAIYSTVGGGDNNTSSGSYSTVSGGRNNTSSGINSTIGGGRYNSSTSNLSTVGGGFANTSSNAYSTVGGGNYNFSTGNRSTIGGGSNNTSSAYGSTIGGGSYGDSSAIGSTVSGGRLNTSSGNYSTVGGGQSNTSSGSRGTVSGGRSNTSSGGRSTVGGGYNNTSSGDYSTIPGGLRGKATRYGELAHSAGRFAANGDAQHTILIARQSTIDATANVVLTLNGGGVSSTNRLTLPSQTAWSFSIKVSAYNNTNNQAAWWIIRGGIRRDNSNNTALVGSLITESGAESSLSAAVATVVADDDNDALEIRVTGVSGTNIRWVAVVDISQVSYGTP